MASFKETQKRFLSLKDELGRAESFLKNNEAVYATDTIRYKMFKEEWTRRKEEIQKQIDGIG